MHGMKRLFLALLVALMAGCLAVSAQGTSNGTLVIGQPLPSQLEAGGVARYDYSLSQPSQVTIQALGDSAQPTIRILRDNAVVAAESNSGGALTTSVSALLDPASYIIEVGTANNTSGLVVTVLQSEVPVSVQTLAPSTPTNGFVNTEAPLALYRFNAFPEPIYIYVESTSTSSGVNVRLVNTATGAVSGQFSPDLLGGRLRVAPGNAVFQVEVRQSAPGSADSFTICFTPVSLGGCENGSIAVPSAQATTALVQPPLATQEVTAACTVTAAASGGVNIRQSASTNSLIVGRLPNGVSTNVVGISPRGDFFNIFYDGTNGWVALSVVSASGSCGGVPVVNPPPIISPPTAVPPPAQATAVTGPCLLSIHQPTYVFNTTNSDMSNLFDQVQPGGQLIPTGRLADNSWWQTNYYNAWIQTSLFGQGVSVSGDCSKLPVVSP